MFNTVQKRLWKLASPDGRMAAIALRHFRAHLSEGVRSSAICSRSQAASSGSLRYLWFLQAMRGYSGSKMFQGQSDQSFQSHLLRSARWGLLLRSIPWWLPRLPVTDHWLNNWLTHLPCPADRLGDPSNSVGRSVLVTPRFTGHREFTGKLAGKREKHEKKGKKNTTPSQNPAFSWKFGKVTCQHCEVRSFAPFAPATRLALERSLQSASSRLEA